MKHALNREDVLRELERLEKAVATEVLPYMIGAAKSKLVEVRKLEKRYTAKEAA